METMVEFDPVNHVYTKDGKVVPSVTQVLADEGFIDTTFFTKEGRDRGTAVHDFIKGYLSGAGCLPLEHTGYFEAFQKFEKLDWKPHTIEKPLANDLFAGTPDQIGHLNGIEAVIDLKTGDIYPSTGLQLAGYELLYGKKLQRFALQLFSDGNYKLTEFKDRNDRYIFQAAVSIWHWKKNNGGRKC